MTTDEIKEEKKVDVNIFGIPETDWLYFKEIIKLYGDRVVAFRALLDSFDRERLLGELLTKIERVEQRLEDLETLKKTEMKKTFGGI